ncbi:MAG: hypothetical protein K8J09_19900 [Planctomycetes bacterium]|nr:hypothetical protein [Planctomycetota bacterium]
MNTRFHSTIAATLLLTVASTRAQHLPGCSNAGGFCSATGLGYALFSANDHIVGMELWRLDQGMNTVALARDIAPGGTGSHPRELTVFLGGYVLVANDGTHGVELWRSNGTVAGTTMVLDINTATSSYPHSLTVVGSRLFFVANDGSHGEELWSYDGTTTTLVKDIVPGAGDSAPAQLCEFAGTLYFTANDGSNGRELWRSDGTGAGTTLLKDIRPGGLGSGPRNLVSAPPYLLFVADDGTHGAEPWRSNGTLAGTVLVKDIEPGLLGSAPGPVTWLLRSFFAATTTTHGRELWTSDGTTAGTVMVADLAPGPDSSNPDDIVVKAVTDVWFVAENAPANRQLWTTTVAATAPTLRTSLPAGSEPQQLTSTLTAGQMVFTDSKGSLWVTDASAAGASPVATFRSGPSNLVRNANLFAASPVLFSAEDATHGTELWATDGTGAGTTMVANIAAETPGQSFVDIEQHVDASGTTVTVCVKNGPPFGIALFAFSATPPSAGVSLPALFTGPLLLSSVLTTAVAICDAAGTACITINIPAGFSTIELAEQGFALDPSTGLPFSSSDLGSLGLTALSSVPLFGGDTKTVGVFDDKDHRFEVNVKLPPLPSSGAHPTGTFAMHYRLSGGKLSKPLNSYAYDGRDSTLYEKDTMTDTTSEFLWVELWFHPGDGGPPVFIWRTYC